MTQRVWVAALGLLCLGVGGAAAQVPLVSSDVITVLPGTQVYHNGDATFTATVTNGGSLHFTGVVTAGVFPQGIQTATGITTDSVRLVGTGPQQVLGFMQASNLTLESGVGPFQLGDNITASELNIGRRFEFSTRVLAAINARLVFGPSATSELGSITRFVDAPIELQRNSTSPAAFTYPYLGSGGLSVYPPITVYSTQMGADNLILRTAAPLAVGTGGSGLPAQRFSRLSTTRHLAADLSGSTGSATLDSIRISYAGENLTSNPNYYRLGIRRALPVTGVYDTLRTFSNTTGLEQLTAGPIPVAPLAEFYLTFGVNKLSAGTIFSVAPVQEPATPNSATLCPPDDATSLAASFELGLSGADPDPLAITWQDSVAASPAFAATIPAGTPTGLTPAPIAEATYYRVIADAGPTFEPDTSNVYTLLPSGLILAANVFLEGRYQVGVDSMPIVPGFAALLDGYYRDAARTPDSTLAALGSLPATAIDVVGLELWTDRTTYSPVPGSGQLGWLLSDGTIVDFRSGNTVIDALYGCRSSVTVPDGSYYVVVQHRNHLPLITAAPVPIASGVRTTVDFTNPNVVYHLLPKLQLGGQFYPSTFRLAMYGGNVLDSPDEAFPFINSRDYSRTFLGNGTIGVYQNEDLNCDGNIDGADILLVQTNNDKLRFSSIPGN